MWYQVGREFQVEETAITQSLRWEYGSPMEDSKFTRVAGTEGAKRKVTGDETGEKGGEGGDHVRPQKTLSGF